MALSNLLEPQQPVGAPLLLVPRQEGSTGQTLERYRGVPGRRALGRQGHLRAPGATRSGAGGEADQAHASPRAGSPPHHRSRAPGSARCAFRLPRDARTAAGAPTTSAAGRTGRWDASGIAAGAPSTAGAPRRVPDALGPAISCIIRGRCAAPPPSAAGIGNVLGGRWTCADIAGGWQHSADRDPAHRTVAALGRAPARAIPLRGWRGQLRIERGTRRHDVGRKQVRVGHACPRAQPVRIEHIDTLP